MIDDRDFDEILDEEIADILQQITGKTSGCWCYDWDPQVGQPQFIYDIATGKCLGQLQPIDYEAIAKNDFLHPHSRGKRDERWNWYGEESPGDGE